MKKFAGLLLALTLAAGWSCAQAQAYPKGTINLIIAQAPGDASDITVRMIAGELSRTLKVPVVVINRPGAGGVVAADSVAKAARDGQTLLFTPNSPLTFIPVLDPQAVKYDALRDFAPLGMVSWTPGIVAVRSDAPYRSFAEMLAFSKKNPGSLRIGTVGAGSVGEFTVAAINAIAGSDLATIPFKGASPTVMALQGGHIEGLSISLSAVNGPLRSGAFRGIAISRKYPDFPDIPTFTELGYPRDLLGIWTGFFAPAGISAEAKSALVPAIENAVNNPQVTAKLHASALVREYLPPQALAERMAEETRLVEEYARKAKLIK